MEHFKKPIKNHLKYYPTKSLKYKFKEETIKELLLGTFQGALYGQLQVVFQEVLKGALTRSSQAKP